MNPQSGSGWSAGHGTWPCPMPGGDRSSTAPGKLHWPAVVSKSPFPPSPDRELPVLDLPVCARTRGHPHTRACTCPPSLSPPNHILWLKPSTLLQLGGWPEGQLGGKKKIPKASLQALLPHGSQELPQNLLKQNNLAFPSPTVSRCGHGGGTARPTGTPPCPPGLLTVVGHGQDGDLGDGAVPALHAPGPLVDGGQVGVHVAGEAAAAGHLLPGCRYLRDGGAGISVGAGSSIPSTLRASQASQVPQVTWAPQAPREPQASWAPQQGHPYPLPHGEDTGDQGRSRGTGTDLPQGFGIGAHVRQDHQHVLLALVGEELGGGQGQAGGYDPLDPTRGTGWAPPDPNSIPPPCHCRTALELGLRLPYTAGP